MSNFKQEDFKDPFKLMDIRQQIVQTVIDRINEHGYNYAKDLLNLNQSYLTESKRLIAGEVVTEKAAFSLN